MKRWCYMCEEEKELNENNFYYRTKEHKKFRYVCKKCSNYESKMNKRINKEKSKFIKECKEMLGL